jgi:hypothetical protein
MVELNYFQKYLQIAMVNGVRNETLWEEIGCYFTNNKDTGGMVAEDMLHLHHQIENKMET